jgi:hypothetical protein
LSSADLLDSRFRGNDVAAWLSVKTLPLKEFLPSYEICLVQRQIKVRARQRTEANVCRSEDVRASSRQSI